MTEADQEQPVETMDVDGGEDKGVVKMEPTGLTDAPPGLGDVGTNEEVAETKPEQPIDPKLEHAKMLEEGSSRKRSRSGSRDRKRRKKRKTERSRRRRRRRSRSNSSRSSSSESDGEDFGQGLKKRRRGERRHRNLWDVEPELAEKLGLLTNLPINIGANGGFMHADRAGRRIYVGNIPLDCKEVELRDFFNAVMIAAQGPGRKPGKSVLGVFLNLPKRFAFVEFRSATEATQAMDLDGIMFRGLNLKMGRPANYNANASSIASRQAPKLNLSKLGIISTHVPNGPNKLYVGGIPYNLKVDQVRELLETYGPLRGLWLSNDPVTRMSKGYAFAYYEDEAVTNAAIDGLNGLQIGDKRMQVKRHESCNSFANGNSDLNVVDASLQEKAKETRTLCLLQMVVDEDLVDPDEVEDIKNDILNECENYGKVAEVVIPTFIDGKPAPGKGKIYVQFETLESSVKCRAALQGRTFAERTVVVSHFDDNAFLDRNFV